MQARSALAALEKTRTLDQLTLVFTGCSELSDVSALAPLDRRWKDIHFP